MTTFKICKDGRIWGQNNKEAGSHLGISMSIAKPPQYNYIKKGFNKNSIGRPFKKGDTSTNKGKKITKECREKIKHTFFKPLQDHPSWRGGISFEPYPLGWTRTHREQVRFRDRYMCQICGRPEVESIRRHSVHHIDYDKNNISIDNLTTLCVSCHSKTNHNRESWKVYFSAKSIQNIKE